MKIVIDLRDDNASSFDELRRFPTWDEVVDNFHIGVDTSLGEQAAGQGERYWACVGVALNEGPTVYRVNVHDQDGNPLGGVEVVRHWPTAPYLVNKSPIYKERGLPSRTEAGGDKAGVIEFVYTGSSRIGPEGGPDAFWIVSPVDGRNLSDMAYGFGWDPRTKHFNPSPLFREMVKGEPVPDPPAPVPATTWALMVLDGEGLPVAHVILEPGAPPAPRSEAWTLALTQNGLIVGHTALER